MILGTMIRFEIGRMEIDSTHFSDNLIFFSHLGKQNKLTLKALVHTTIDSKTEGIRA